MRHVGVFLRRFTTTLNVCVLALLVSACAPKPAPEPELEPEPAPAEAPETPPEPDRPEPYATRTLRTRSNIRSEPTTRSEIVTTQDAGTEVGYLDLEDGWYRVLVADSIVGWVYASLVNLTEDDRWMAAISAARPNWNVGDLFTAVYRDGEGLTIVLDIAWRDISMERKEQIVESVGEAWRAATQRLGMTPPPEITFMSNNDYEMATWHGFWGGRVKH